MPFTSCIVLTPADDPNDLDPAAPSSRLSPLSETAGGLRFSLSDASFPFTWGDDLDGVMVEADDEDEELLSIGAASHFTVAQSCDPGWLEAEVRGVEWDATSPPPTVDVGWIGGEGAGLREEEVLGDAEGLLVVMVSDNRKKVFLGPSPV